MREKGTWSSEVHTERVYESRARGSVTHEGEQRAREGRGLDPLVDPKEYGGIRRSYNLLVPDGDGFVLTYGVGMPVKTALDTTGSMGGNVEIAFSVLPKVHKLLVQGPQAVLRRYHVHIATSVVQDQGDRFPLQTSQFEPDNEIDRQMSLLVPEKGGGDAPEDYQLDLFATAFLIDTVIAKYGLKGYYFVVGDEIGRDRLTKELMKRVFNAEALEALGPQIPQATKEIGQKLLEHWHGFFLQVGGRDDVTEWWSNILGRERVIILPRTEDIAEVQACIIGLTEGQLDLQSAASFLIDELHLSKGKAQEIVRAVSGIPIAAQTTAPNFDKIPPAGSRFANREDLWPSESAGVPVMAAAESGEGSINWKL